MNNDQNNKVRIYTLKFFKLFVALYIPCYSLTAIWVLFDGWINDFQSIYWIWNIHDREGIPALVELALYTILGAILGGAFLSIISFHKYVAIEKSFDTDHLWGFIFTPILTSIVGLIVFTLFQSGLLVLSGSIGEREQPLSAGLGFTAIGCIFGYNWDVVISKLQKLARKLAKDGEDKE